jgi:sporadic carbohydrate cluster 2OG-Fe(II) oxygenase|tara:strand:- start:46 stop:840 length:795 start_codon:yes stop_codon:yes gene_type:complete
MPEKKNRFFREFETLGYSVVAAEDKSALEQVRNEIFKEAKQLLEVESEEVESFFNEFHKRKLKPTALNDFRVNLIRKLNQRVDVGLLISQAIGPKLFELLGPDIAVQNSTNIVIHQPGDTDIPPIHRDSPPNSPFEVVVWVPLVHCHGTKGISIMNIEDNALGTSILLGDNDKNGSELREYSMKHGERVDMGFGEVLIFWAPLIHDIPVNKENETRWSLNLRYKNLFSPYGTVGFPDYFRILRTSSLSRLALDFEKSRFKDAPK